MKNTGMQHPQDVINWSDSVAQLVLAAGVGQAVDVPAGANLANFSSNGIDFWVRFGSTAAAIPTTSTTAGSSTLSILSPEARTLGSTLGCSVISIISPSSGYALVEFFSK
jgi:hypothetical protein